MSAHILWEFSTPICNTLGANRSLKLHDSLLCNTIFTTPAVANLEHMGGPLQEAFINTHTVVSPDVAANVQLQFIANFDGMVHWAAPTGDVAAILQAGL